MADAVCILIEMPIFLKGKIVFPSSAVLGFLELPFIFISERSLTFFQGQKRKV
jgi:hypothetical protein